MQGEHKMLQAGSGCILTLSNKVEETGGRDQEKYISLDLNPCLSKH